MSDETVNVRYMVDDVAAAVDFYTKHLGFTEQLSTCPPSPTCDAGSSACSLSGPQSSAGRPMPDGAKPAPGGWNRIHLIFVRPRRPRSTGCAVKASRSATTSSPDPAAPRSSSRIPRATWSSSSNRRADGGRHGRSC